MAYLIYLGTLIAIYAILGVSLNLVVGYTGMISVTHAAFFGLGAYATAILTAHYGTNFFLSLLLGMLVSGALALLIGAVLSRLSGDYYVLGTVGFNLIMTSVFLNWDSFTGGPLGVPGIPRPALGGVSFASNASFFLLTLLILLFAYGAGRFLTASSFGRVLKAIREDEEAIRVFGYSTFSYKLAVFVIAAMLAAAAGSLFASFIGFIDPTGFDVLTSVFILSIVILGGFANLEGSLLGALLLVLVPEALRFVGFPSEVAGQMRQALYGLLLVLLMLYRPQGLVGEYKF